MIDSSVVRRIVGSMDRCIPYPTIHLYSRDATGHFVHGAQAAGRIIFGATMTMLSNEE